MCPGVIAIRNQPVLPPARENAEYSTSFLATGGSGGYTFRIESGALPVGLALTGELLHGTPVSASVAPHTFALRVTDSLGNTAVKDFRLPVTPERTVTVAARLD